MVRSYLRDGVDGWRLDVAFDIGPNYLSELTRAAHDEKPGSLVVGEIPNYPRDWLGPVDGVMHFALRHLILRLAGGQISAPVFGAMVNRMVADCGVESLLKSWIYLDNHDTPRLATSLPVEAARRLAQVLQFTLPGSPNLYYGGEIDMQGGDDPTMRGPMRWEQVNDANPHLQWTKKLAHLHQSERALKLGNYRPILAEKLFAFERYTDHVADTVLVLVNPGDSAVSETLMVANSKLMDGTHMIDLLGTQAGEPFTLRAALLPVQLPAKSCLVLKPEVAPPGGYTNYKRVQ